MQKLPYQHKVIKVTEEMCDLNGHMNVNYYYKIFDSSYTSFYINELGFDKAYLERVVFQLLLLKITSDILKNLN